MKWYIDAFKKYAVFSGRSSRQAYWMFFLFALLTSFAIGFATGVVQAITHADLMLIPNPTRWRCSSRALPSVCAACTAAIAAVGG
ncbi:MAG: DUF805 domain-containing protein [Burkholderiales bacterium]|nr:DUF805 domain-containing protein [Burkholderiales bacterium]MBH2017796.1 DUF805 domain-containing protein [Burkholderiales bacterium]